MTDTHADAHGHAHAVPKHPYHLVDPSPWPIVGSIAAGLLATGGVLFMHGYGWWLMANRLPFRAGDDGRVVARRDPRATFEVITRPSCSSGCVTAWRCSSPPR
jgi:hypothetical protein